MKLGSCKKLALLSIIFLPLGFYNSIFWAVGYLLLFIAAIYYLFGKAKSAKPGPRQMETTFEAPPLENRGPRPVTAAGIHLPAVMESGGVVEINRAFADIFGGNEVGRTLYKQLDTEAYPHILEHNGNPYLVLKYEDKAVHTAYFLDLSKIPQLQGESNTEVAVGLIFIDNYDETMESVEESMRPLVTALLDRKINGFAQELDGITRKFEKDRYMLVFGSDRLEGLKKSRFEILKQIKDVSFGNKMPFTLSIGIGIGGQTLRKNMEYARAAIDLSLGRGGDQALIKNVEEYEFYGGVNKEIEPNSAVRARVKSYALSELISESPKVMVMGHRNADLDCLGADVGIYKICQLLGKNCKIILNGSNTSIAGMYDRLMAEAGYGDIIISPEVALETLSPETLLIVVDSHRPSILESPEILTAAEKRVVIDHHRKGAEYVHNPVLTYHEPYASSTCELVVELIRYLGNKISFKPVEADIMLAGIVVDTKNYVIKTGTKTFEAAAFLRRAGADTVRVRMAMQNDIESYKAKANAVNGARTFDNHIAIASCPPYVENPTLLNAQIADDLLNISGIEASFSLYFDHAAETVYISARSLGDINVQAIMEKLDGGGHQTAAGAQVRNEDMKEVEDQLKECISAYLASMQ